MKFSRAIFNIAAIGLLYFSTFSLAGPNNGATQTLTETYSKPKNIGFSVFFGGSSHYVWVLIILEELRNRGHNVTFVAKSDELHHAKRFPGINIYSVGPDVGFEDKDSVFTGLEEISSDIKMKLLAGTIIKDNWKNDYLAILEFIKTNNVDLMLCDHFSEACIDASQKAGIPFIVTSVLEMTSDSDTPYVNVLGMTVDDFSTEYQSIYKRFKDYFIEPLEMLYEFWDFFKEFADIKKSAGVDTFSPPSEAWKDSIKLVNSFFGLTPPRPMGSLIEQIGPIIPRDYTPLTDYFENYLENNKKVVYVSFGQHATPSQNTIRLILTSLLENLESGEIDGIIWAVVLTKNSFPESVTTSSNTIYSVSEIFDGKYPDIHFETWVPQMAILLHPSTHIFVSHGGFGSCVESMYAGKRMVIFPSYADQFGNAMALERYNVGVSVRTPIDLKDLTSKIKRMASDKDGKIKYSLKRMQAIVQIRSQNGPKIGADVVEEVAFSHIDGQIPHRYAASRRLSFIKAHNIDIYAIFAAILLISLFSVVFGISRVLKYLKRAYLSEKKLKKK